MILSVTSDTGWQVQFKSLPSFVVPDRPLLVVAPHPDDETLGAGALIWTLRQRGIPVTVVAATDGENAYDTSADEREALGRTREVEQRDALAELNIPADAIRRLRLTDSGLSAQEPQLIELLHQIAEPGMTVLAPWSGDFHPDHEACARAAASVARSKDLPLISYFFWTWHRGTPELLQTLPLRRFNFGPKALEAKTHALAKHRSQLEHADGDPILPERLLGPARWPCEIFLPV